MRPLIIIGSGYHAGVVIDALSRAVEIVGLLDDFEPVGATKHGYRNLGKVEGVKHHPALTHCDFFVAVGDNAARAKLRSQVDAPNERFINIIHPRAWVSNNCELGYGNYIGANAVVQRGCLVGNFSIINTGAILEHDSLLGSYAHLAPGAVTGGLVSIGDGTFIGLGTAIRDRVTIGNHAMVGMGSVVVSDLRSHFQGFGNPCK